MSFTTQTPLEKGVLPRVTQQTINKLRAAGITTVEALFVTSPLEIVALSGVTIETAERLIEKARHLVAPGFIPANKYRKILAAHAKCTTGSKEFDRILGGGIQTGVITELIGEFGTGKTQTLLTLLVNAQQPVEKGGLGGKCVAIDTENTLKPNRITQIAKARGYDPEEVLSNILVAPAYNTEHLLLLIRQLHKICQENNVKLVVVDSIIGHFRSEYIGREMLSPRQQKLAQCLAGLLRVAIANNVAVVIANQVQSQPAKFFGDPLKAAGGNIMGHAGTYRVRLWKGRANTRLAAVIDASDVPEEKIRFAITEAGVVDVEE